MRKIRLELDTLAVESFAAEAPGAARGTAAGHEQQLTVAAACTHTQNDQMTCARRNSYFESCVVDCECTNARFRCIDHT